MTGAKYQELAPGYTALDQYRDFAELFTKTDLGRRVLSRIMVMGHMGKSGALIAQFDTNRTMFVNGEQALARTIHQTAHVEPEPKPTQATGSRSPLRKDS